jgi:hypothetical protein
MSPENELVKLEEVIELLNKLILDKDKFIIQSADVDIGSTKMELTDSESHMFNRLAIKVLFCKK